MHLFHLVKKIVYPTFFSLSVNSGKVEKLAWIWSHYLHLQWQLKLLAEKFVDNAQQCFVFTPQAIFPLIIWIFTKGEGGWIESRLPLRKNILIQISPKPRFLKRKKSDWFLSHISDYIGYLVIFLPMTLSFPKRKKPGKIPYLFNSQTGEIIDCVFKYPWIFIPCHKDQISICTRN